MNTEFHIEEAFAAWRSETSGTGSLRTCDIEELEGHLRDGLAELQSCGLSNEEAFHLACRRLGGPEIEREFAKVHPNAIWAERGRWALFGALGFDILWDGLRACGDLLDLALGYAFQSPFAMLCGYWIGAFGMIAFYSFVLVRLVRGQWRASFPRRFPWLYNPASLATLVIIGTVARYALQIARARLAISLGPNSGYYSLMNTANYLTFGAAFIALIGLTVAAALANRRQKQTLAR